jgi:ribose transport system permease protein
MFRFASHQKTLVIAVLLVVLTIVCQGMQAQFLGEVNIGYVLKYAGLYGIITLGVSFVIATGGIDLSIGSWIGFSAVLTPVLITMNGMSAAAALGVVLSLSVVAGLLHGLLVTRMGLQPFLVTLCGLFIYRGLARVAGSDRQQLLPESLTWIKQTLIEGRPLGSLPVPAVFVLLLVLCLAGEVLINKTVWGRHLLATGRNEQAARFSGVNTAAVRVLAYVICSTLAGLSGVLWLAEIGFAQGTETGKFYELWAIAGAVLGACSLRGGECSMAGVLLGILMVAVIKQGVLLAVDDSWKEVVIGLFVLGGVILDELMSRWLARRK